MTGTKTMHRKTAAFFILATLTSVCACATFGEDDDPPAYYDVAVDTDAMIFKTDDIRISDVGRYRIEYEYKDKSVTLAQLGKMAKRFCYAKGRDTVLVGNTTTKRDGLRRATFECQVHPVLVP